LILNFNDKRYILILNLNVLKSTFYSKSNQKRLHRYLMTDGKISTSKYYMQIQENIWLNYAVHGVWAKEIQHELVSFRII